MVLNVSRKEQKRQQSRFSLFGRDITCNDIRDTSKLRKHVVRECNTMDTYAFTNYLIACDYFLLLLLVLLNLLRRILSELYYYLPLSRSPYISFDLYGITCKLRTYIHYFTKTHKSATYKLIATLGEWHLFNYNILISSRV